MSQQKTCLQRDREISPIPRPDVLVGNAPMSLSTIHHQPERGAGGLSSATIHTTPHRIPHKRRSPRSAINKHREISLGLRLRRRCPCRRQRADVLVGNAPMSLSTIHHQPERGSGGPPPIVTRDPRSKTSRDLSTTSKMRREATKQLKARC